MSGSIGSGLAPAEPVATVAAPLPVISAPAPLELPAAEATGDAVAATSRRGQAPTPGEAHGVDWGRVAIHAGMAPLSYPVGLYLHERGGHGLMVQAQGGTITGMQMLPQTYEREDGSTGVTFGSLSYREGEDWGKTERTLVSLGPSLLDATILTGTTTLFETGNWPRNPWASGALLMLHTAATVDLGNAAQVGILHPEGGSDTAHAGRTMDVSPRVLGAVEGAVAVGGAVELVRIAAHAFRKQPDRPPGRHPIQVSVAPKPDGGTVRVSGRF